jgi:hypothetical protein
MPDAPHRSHNHNKDEHTQDIQRTLEHNRPPTLNPTCLGHGDQGGGLQGDNEHGNGGFHTNETNEPDAAVAATYMSDTEDDGYSSDFDFLSGQEGVENAAELAEIEVGDLGRHSLATIRSAPSAEYPRCHWYNCSCPCRFQRAASPKGDSLSMAVSPSYSPMHTSIGSMKVEVGSMQSSISFDQYDWNPSDLCAHIRGGVENGDFVNVYPHNFSRAPLCLTSAPACEVLEFQYALELDDSDFEPI